MSRCNIPRSVFMVSADTGTTFRNVGLNDENSKSVALSQIDTTKVSSLKDLIGLYQRNLCNKDVFRFKQVRRLRARRPHDDAEETNADDTVVPKGENDVESVISTYDDDTTNSPPPNQAMSDKKGLIGNIYD